MNLPQEARIDSVEWVDLSVLSQYKPRRLRHNTSNQECMKSQLESHLKSSDRCVTSPTITEFQHSTRGSSVVCWHDHIASFLRFSCQHKHSQAYSVLHFGDWRFGSRELTAKKFRKSIECLTILFSKPLFSMNANNIIITIIVFEYFFTRVKIEIQWTIFSVL